VTIYLLDANVFIQAKKLHYGFDICPAFWDWLDREHKAGIVVSIEQVATELIAGADDLAAWAQARPSMFLSPDRAMGPSLTTVASWAQGAGYEPAAVSTFLQLADYWLVAQAHWRKSVVVTHELPSPVGQRSAKRIRSLTHALP